MWKKNLTVHKTKIPMAFQHLQKCAYIYALQVMQPENSPLQKKSTYQQKQFNLLQSTISAGPI